MLRDALLAQINEHLRNLPAEKLSAILNYVESQAANQLQSERKEKRLRHDITLTNDWNHPEDLEAWRNL